MEPKTITVALESPVEFNGKTYTELTFHKRKVKHLAAMDLVKGETRKTAALYAAMANVPIQVIEEVDGDDFERLAKEILPLMGKSFRKAFEEAQAKVARKASEDEEPAAVLN